MLTLMKLPTAWGIRNASAFNLKAEALLALSGVQFDAEEALPNKGPKGKLPALKTPEGVIGDSAMIHKYLMQKHGFDIDIALTTVQRADALAYQKMAEEYLYFIALYIRWIVEPEETKIFFAGIPGVLRGFVFGRLQKAVKRTLHGQGLARHSDEEIFAFGKEVLDALDARIGDGPFFFGDAIHSIDAALYPQIVNITDAPYHTGFNEYARSKPRLIAYAKRCDARVFGGKTDDA
jgi:glutathione S-transferase